MPNIGVTINSGITIGNGINISRPDLVFLTSSFIASSTTITVPTDAAAGDVAILFNACISASTPTDVIPSGWTGIGTNNNATGRIRSSYKVLVSGDIGATVTGMTATTQNLLMVIFRSQTGTISSLSAVQSLSQPSGSWSTTSVSPTITTSGATLPSLALGFWYGTSVATTASAMTFVTGISNANILSAYRILNRETTATDTTTSTTSTTFLGYQTFYFNVTIA